MSDLIGDLDRAGLASLLLTEEVRKFLYREVRLFEAERYEEWLETLTEDIHYWMPGIQARYRKDPGEVISRKRMAHFDEDMPNLRRRIVRATHETAWAEDPRTRSCYMVSNIEVEPAEVDGEYAVRSVLLNCRGRAEVEEDWIMVRREDVLRRGEDGALRLASREIYTTQSVILSKNINILF
jgi:ethylbenzene dioxygenase beta subunit